MRGVYPAFRMISPNRDGTRTITHKMSAKVTSPETNVNKYQIGMMVAEAISQLMNSNPWQGAVNYEDVTFELSISRYTSAYCVETLSVLSASSSDNGLTWREHNSNYSGTITSILVRLDVSLFTEMDLLITLQ